MPKKPKKEIKKRKKTRQEGEEEEIEEAIEEIIMGGASASEGGELAPLLLEMISVTSKLAILLSETSEGEFKLIKPRLDSFILAVESLPRDSKIVKTLGFKQGNKQ